MNITVWPFLISRNKTQEYRAVIAPPFLLEDAHAAGFLAEASGGDPTEPGLAIYREIHGLKYGDLTLVFHVMKAGEQHLGLKTTKLLLDQSKRPINLTEGFVLEGKRSDIHVTSDIFDSVHRQLEDVYKLFWEHTEGSFKVYASRSMDVDVIDDENKHLQLKTKPPFLVLPDLVKESEKKPEDMSQKNRRLIVVGGVAVAVATTLAGIFLSKRK